MKHLAVTENIVATKSGVQWRNRSTDCSVSVGSSSSFVDLQVLKFRCLSLCHVTLSTTVTSNNIVLVAYF
jgi:hypothetical protein